MGAARYKPYPTYKPSGVEWLGDIPEGWEHAPLKYLALDDKSLFLDGDWIESKDLSENGIRYITTGNVGEGAYKEQGGGYISEKTFQKLDASEVFEGDILVSRLNAPIGRACIVPNLNNRIVTSVDNVIFRPDAKFCRSFVVYMLSSNEYFGHTSNMARGATMQRISRGLLGNIRIVFPSLPEQTKIAAFLDFETGKIDALIAKQERLIALLEEKRQAVISHAVTKGLNPGAPLRPSGIDWLGDVPEHWEVKRAKHVANIFVPQRNKPDLNRDTGIAWATMEDMKSKHIEQTQLRVDSASAQRSGSKILKRGAVIASCVGNFGICSINQVDVIINQQLQAFIPISIQPEYLRAIVGISKVYFELVGTAATLVYVNQQGFENLPIVLPPPEEQRDICKFIEQQETKFKALDAKAQSAITLFKERRTALISAAVTGKIDVRDWQPPQPLSDTDLSTENLQEAAL